MGLMQGKSGVVVGVANQHSIAWAIAERLHKEGARVALTYANEGLRRRVEGLSKRIESPLVVPCDVTDDAQLASAMAAAAAALDGGLDFVVHAVAFAPERDLKAKVVGTSRQGFHTTMDISVYSFIGLVQAAAPYLRPNAGALTLSYLGAERVCVGYNIMGVAKAALEASCRYLAADLGPRGIRVNAISSGPIRTSAAIGLPNFQEMLAKRADQSPLGRNVDQGDVANSAAFLLSDLSRSTTGTVLHVDGGYNVMGTWTEASEAPAKAPEEKSVEEVA